MDVFGFLLTATLGFLGFFYTKKIADMIGYGERLSSLGLLEFKATYGAFFFTLGLLGLYLRTDEVAIVVGGAWLSASSVRAFTLIIQRNDIAKNIGGIVIEASIGLLIFFG